MQFRFSIADKISITIVVVGVLSVLLVLYISESYKNFAYSHHDRAIEQLAMLEINDLIDNLEKDSLDLALAIENEDSFRKHYKYRDADALKKQLDNQFYQYFVTADVVKLLKLYALDTSFTLISRSGEGIKTSNDTGLMCPKLSQKAMQRKGSEKLQTLSLSCQHNGYPVFAVLVPFGGLNPTGYIQVVTDLAYKLRDLETSLAMPLQINQPNGALLHETENWQATTGNRNYLTVTMPVSNEEGQTLLKVSLRADMTGLNKEIFEHRNWVLALAVATTALTVLLVLFFLQRTTIPPLAKIHDVIERIHMSSHDDTPGSRILFEQLLERIIYLRRKSDRGFSVMIIDLTQFSEINSKYGETTGDELLMLVEQRLGTILRDSDLISWVGTDSPGHKLAPSGTNTQYRATIARLGGDEFGLLLPSANNAEQATAVAERIVNALSDPFEARRHKISITCRIGVSIYPQHGEDEKELIRHADKAMYHARESDSRVAIYSETD